MKEDHTHMNRKPILVATTAALLCAPLFAETTPPTDSPPNVIVCMVDDMGFSDPACFGGEIETPNLDRLAAGGVRLVNFLSASRCCPSRASILTGLHPQQAGVGYMTRDSGHPAYSGKLSRPHVTIPETLKPAGYTSAISGKWHLNPMPKDVGFDTAETWFAYGATSFFYRFDQDGLPSKETDPTFYATDYFADGVVDLIDRHAGKQPFFIYWTPTAPHYPLHAKEEDVKKYRPLYAEMTPEDIARVRYKRILEMGLFEASHPWAVPETVNQPMRDDWRTDYRLDANPVKPHPEYNPVAKKSLRYNSYNHTSDPSEVMAIYAAMVDRFDQGLGRVLAKLEATGELENTLIVFCSDNGCSDERFNIGPPLAHASNTPFLKAKKSAYFGGTGSPFILYWPAKTPADKRGSINPSFGHIVDVMPTVIEAAGGSYPETDRQGRDLPAMEGRSLLPILEGDVLTFEEPFCMEHRGNCAVIKGKWKITSDRQEPWQLFDLSTDRFERNNLADEHPEIVQELAADWQAWADRTGALRTGEPKRP